MRQERNGLVVERTSLLVGRSLGKWTGLQLAKNTISENGYVSSACVCVYVTKCMIMDKSDNEQVDMWVARPIPECIAGSWKNVKENGQVN